MRKFIVLAFLLIALASFASAQVPTAGNVFFGYSYYNTNLSPLGRTSTNGWEGSLEGKIFPFLGIVADFDGHYGSPDYPGPVFCPNCSSTVSVSTSFHNVLFGPRVSASVGRFRPFAEGLVGIGHAAISGGNSSTSFASGIGGGLDYRIIRPIAWRFQGDYLQTRFFSGRQDNARFSTGIVFNF